MFNHAQCIRSRSHKSRLFKQIGDSDSRLEFKLWHFLRHRPFLETVDELLFCCVSVGLRMETSDDLFC
ncbi:Uncharacterised protein [Vibrio cholerae]|nr:Uncharacterised protein [Vibrio cholerae]CSI96306.1 Uncharacterised protein [Vibrio cholerae]